MSWLEKIFGNNQPKSAQLAKERLTLVIAHQRTDSGGGQPDFLPALQKELIAVISKYVKIDADDIKVQLEKKGNYEVLEVNIVMPEGQNR